jgi:hypothetical protein
MSRYPITNKNWRDGTTVWEWHERSREWFAYAEQTNRHNQRTICTANPIRFVLLGGE